MDQPKASELELLVAVAKMIGYRIELGFVGLCPASTKQLGLTVYVRSSHSIRG